MTENDKKKKKKLPGQWMLQSKGGQNACPTAGDYGFSRVFGKKHLSPIRTKTTKDDCLQRRHNLQDMLKVRLVYLQHLYILEDTQALI